MKAKFETTALKGALHTSSHKYKNIHNLPHWHMEYELIYVFSGSAEIMINNAFFEISANMCAFISSEDIHYIKSTSESIVGVIKTNADYVKNITKNKRLMSPVFKCNSSVVQTFNEIAYELNSENNFREIVADAAITKLVAEIFRNETIIENTPQKTTKYKELLELISNDYSHVTFSDAAEYMKLNKSYFSRYFYSLSGMTFTQYLNFLKVSAAIEKILDGKLSMTEISIACGFGTIRNFNRVFKAFTGYSPKNLPLNYTLIYNFKDFSSNGFDPTLNCTEIIE